MPEARVAVEATLGRGDFDTQVVCTWPVAK
jgi:hypothetical protein